MSQLKQLSSETASILRHQLRLLWKPEALCRLSTPYKDFLWFRTQVGISVNTCSCTQHSVLQGQPVGFGARYGSPWWCCLIFDPHLEAPMGTVSPMLIWTALDHRPALLSHCSYHTFLVATHFPAASLPPHVMVWLWSVPHEKLRYWIPGLQTVASERSSSWSKRVTGSVPWRLSPMLVPPSLLPTCHAASSLCHTIPLPLSQQSPLPWALKQQSQALQRDSWIVNPNTSLYSYFL